jgi:oxygen-independent coproporphyrinogen-3 oxidase
LSPNIDFPLSPATVNHHKQSLEDEMSEFMMTGLRLTQEGVSEEEFQKRFGQSLFEVYGNEIEELLKLGLIEQIDKTPLSNGEGWVRLTKYGRLLGNQVFMRFI